jgi:hypothetical protein
MSPFDDDQDMRALDDTDELLLTGQGVPPAEAGLAGRDVSDGLAGFVAELRATAQEAAPRPSAALGALLRDGLPPSRVAVRSSARSAAGARSIRASAWRHPWRSVAGLGLAAKIVLGAGVAVASVGGAATIDAVPDAVQRPARAVVTGVAGLFSTDPAVRDPGAPAPVGTTSTTPSPTAVPPGADPDDAVDGAPGEGNSVPAVPLPAVPLPAVPLPEITGPEITVPPLPGSGRPTDLPTVVPDAVGLLRSGGLRAPVPPPSAVVPPARVGPPVSDPDVLPVP